MSLFQNFMGNVITISKYYERYLQSMQVNDVDQMAFYVGKVTHILLDFD